MPRGRPRKNPPQDEGLDAVLDPADQALDGEALTPAKDLPKAAAKPTGPSARSRQNAVRSGASLLKGAHAVGAKMLNEPQLALSDDEAKALAIASVDLLAVYGVDLARHPKSAAWAAFVATCIEIEAPRVMLLVTRPPARRRNERADANPPPVIVLPDETALPVSPDLPGDLPWAS